MCWSLVCPGLARPAGTAPGAWEKPNCQNSKAASSPTWEAGCPHASAFFVPVGSAYSPRPRESPRQTKPVAEPYLSLLACRPGVVCLAGQYLLPPYVPSSGPAGLPLCPRARCHHPQQALPGPSQDNCGTKLAPLEPSPRPPPHPTPPSLVRPGPRMHRRLSLLLLF